MPKARTTIELSSDEKSYLENILKKPTIEVRVYKRAKALLMKAEGFSYEDIEEKLDLTRPSIRLCIDKYLEGGLNNALDDKSGRGVKAEIFDDAKLWVINIACQKPKDFGYSAELWYPALLTKYINSVAVEEGYSRMATVSVSTVRKILREAKLNPHKVTYYCEKRDPDFDKKMHDVLVVYKQLELRFDEDGEFIPYEADEEIVHTISYDEKPGIQAISCTSEDRAPIPCTAKTSTFQRDYEYKRLGTLSLLAGIDLLSGDAIPYVSETHKSSDFICFLKKLDEKYPKGDKIRLILDNHSAHTSRETQEYLNTVPNRFEFVFTPTHGSWLNMIEGFFSTMTRQMLMGIRVSSKSELEERIYQYFNEINSVPVPYKWKYKLDTIDLEKENLTDIIYEVVNAKAASYENQGKRAPVSRRKKSENSNEGNDHSSS